jgi:hypothetical protein
MITALQPRLHIILRAVYQNHHLVLRSPVSCMNILLQIGGKRQISMVYQNFLKTFSVSELLRLRRQHPYTLPPAYRFM